MKIFHIKKSVLFIVGFILIATVLVTSFELITTRGNAIDCAIYKAKASLFQSAINEFGAICAVDAASLWAKGVKTRNGALQYAVMSDTLKEAFSAKLEKERPSWVTGVSSPWVNTYTIMSNEEVGEFTCEIIVRFNLMTSTGDAGSYDVRLMIAKAEKYWVIKKITGAEPVLGL